MDLCLLHDTNLSIICIILFGFLVRQELVNPKKTVFFSKVALFIAEIPIKLSVGAENKRLRGMVVLGPARIGEHRYLTVRFVIAIIVGEYPDVRRGADDDLVAKDTNAHGAIDIAALVINCFLVADAILIGVLEDQYAVAFRTFSIVLAIVDDLTYTNTATVINVEICDT